MGRPQISVIKRQREQAKRERQQVKAAKRAQRKSDKALGIDSDIDIEIQSEAPNEEPTLPS